MVAEGVVKQQETRCLRFSGESSRGTQFPNTEIFPILFSWRDTVVWETLNWRASSVEVTVGVSVTTTFNSHESSYFGRPSLSLSFKLKFPFWKRGNYHLQLLSLTAIIL